jgi:hypothetical protein
LVELCRTLPQTASLGFVAADIRNRGELETIATLSSPKLQAAALDLLTGIGGPGCIPVIGEFGPSAKAISPLLLKQLSQLTTEPEASKDRAREGMLNAALAAIDPEAFAARLRRASAE